MELNDSYTSKSWRLEVLRAFDGVAPDLAALADKIHVDDAADAVYQVMMARKHEIGSLSMELAFDVLRFHLRSQADTKGWIRF